MEDLSVMSVRKVGGGLLGLLGIMCVGCVLAPEPRQMYDGAPLPKEQVGIIRSGCAPEGNLNIMVFRVDGREVSHVCADFAVMPGEHELELGAERVAPALAAPPLGTGGVLGAPPQATARTQQQGPRVVWRGESPMKITCTVQAGQEVTIVGTAGAGTEWQARCQ
jgi:hypothetical protein